MSFRLLHYSDPHFGASDERVANAAILIAQHLEPDLTVVSGDFSMRGRKWEFEAAQTWLAKLPKPLLTFPGNHDVPGLNQLADRFFSPFRRFRKYISEVEEPSAKLGNVGALCSANSSTPFGLHLDWSRGFLGPMQAHAASTFFADLPEDQLRVFAMHHPVLGSGQKARALVSPMPMVSSFLQRSRVDLVLAGHFHQSKTALFPSPNSDSRSLVVSQAPSICSTRLKGEPNGFHLITLEKDAIEIELWRWDLDRFKPSYTRSFQLHENGWTNA
ncbi:metallophosphoesterase family protein [Luteolibacter sp. AS25]|uniref:metallophosphoesterase family protein n=1 Tax=Luteolibacter sp. AS25 TaxID=3135776 RepID=UPI00398B07DC